MAHREVAPERLIDRVNKTDEKYRFFMISSKYSLL